MSAQLILINETVLPKLHEYKVALEALYEEADRAMDGSLTKSFIGYFPKITLSFRHTTEAEMQTIAGLLNNPSFTVDYYDPTTDATYTQLFYASSFEMSTYSIDRGLYEPFSVNIIAEKKQGNDATAPTTLNREFNVADLSDVELTSLTNGQVLVYNSTTQQWENGAGGGGGGASAFTDLTDAPSSYVGHAGEVPQVNVGEDGLAFFDVQASIDAKLTEADLDLQLATDGGAVTTDEITTGGYIDTSATALRLTGTDASKKLVSLDTATYPSLTELSFLKGATSGVQGQLDGKANLFNNVITVNASGGADYTDIADAIAFINGLTGSDARSATNRYTIIVYPGNYQITTLNVPSYVTLVGTDKSVFILLPTTASISGQIVLNTGSVLSNLTISAINKEPTGVVGTYAVLADGTGILIDTCDFIGHALPLNNPVTHEAAYINVTDGSSLEIRNCNAFINPTGASSVGPEGSFIRYDSTQAFTWFNNNVAIKSTRASYTVQAIRFKKHPSSNNVNFGSIVVSRSSVGNAYAINRSGVGGVLSSNNITMIASDGINNPTTVNSINGFLGTLQHGEGVGTDKVGLFGATPVTRPTTGIAEAAFTANTGNAVNDNSTFGGYTIQQVVQALQDIGILT